MIFDFDLKSLFWQWILILIWNPLLGNPDLILCIFLYQNQFDVKLRFILFTLV